MILSSGEGEWTPWARRVPQVGFRVRDRWGFDAYADPFYRPPALDYHVEVLDDRVTELPLDSDRTRLKKGVNPRVTSRRLRNYFYN